MKKLVTVGMVLVATLSLMLAGCTGGGTPKAPVKTLLNLDKLVTVNMTVDQVNALMTPALKLTGVLYQADKIEQGNTGWAVSTKEGGYKAGEQGPFQALFFTPTKAGDNYLVIFLKGNAVMAKAWFVPQAAVIIEALLQGKKLTN